MHLFTGLSQLLTLRKAAKKDGRHVQASDLSIIRNAAFIVNKGRFVWIGQARHLTKDLRKKVLRQTDLQGAVVMPGLVECHTHSVFAGSRADEFEMRNQGVSYQEINRKGGGIRSTVKATRKASEQSLFELAQSRTDRFVEQGVTTLEVKSGYGLNRSSEFKMLRAAGRLKGPRIVRTYLGPHSLPPECRCYSDYIDHIIRKDLAIVAQQKLAERADIFIENGFFDTNDGERYLRAARQHGLRLTIHADQLSRSGATRLGVRLGADSVDHVVKASRSDIEALAQSSTTAVLLPAADFYLKIAYPKAREMIDQGVKVALASDFNPGSSPTQDLSFVGLLARTEMKMTLSEVIAAYTVNAASALACAHEIGSIQEGFRADFLVLKESWSELFYHVGDPLVHSVWKGGVRMRRARQKS